MRTVKARVALRRFATVSFIEQKVREVFGVVEALRLAALRPWPDMNDASDLTVSTYEDGRWHKRILSV